ncbi:MULTISPECIES: Holliday junction resolvase RuvX [unclassified Gemella]|uniref:Holliday junction resolvase RuvX n=1 Tax=unclassified Gemella TaxID=2624949 RepID=UPI001C05C65F|nr:MULTISPECIES: Holliday junction resolvase RuvX [unclassified Gemella]MBU0278132.1 Holliday junction resolvase RuvX [Gemella sp. zg-1178]QWQ38343.1 Holliday junction resolvase RuvX [Gemella sp. zg-570]
MSYSRIMGLDYGSKTIGVAISDPLKITAQGIETLQINEAINDFKIKRIKEFVKEYSVVEIVVGLPKNMDNSLGFRAEATLNFVEILKNKIKNVEVILQDERLSTMSAERVLLEADVSRKKRKKVIDKMAAVFILQTYLDKLR